MKIIGKLEGGSLLVLMTAGEIDACETIARVVFQMAAHEVDQAKRLTQRPKGPKTQKGRGTTLSGPVRDKVCSVCGRKFRDTSQTNSRKFCSAKCAKPRPPAPEPQRTLDVNPSDPSLTDAQRAELLRKRERMIRDSVERLGAGRREKDVRDA